MPTVIVQYFAQLRDARGLGQERLTTAAERADVLFDALATQHAFKVPRGAVRVAVNDAIVRWDTPLSDGDSVVFLPPVSGG
jgi:molybdopterin synthase sulfur carrier subunit